MSAPSIIRARPIDEARERALRLVHPVRSRARRTPFVVVVIVVLSVGLTGLILLSTVLQAQSFETTRLAGEVASLETRHQELARRVDRLESPASVAERATGLGMVPNRNPVFLSLADGAVLGRPQPATKGSNVERIDR